MDNSESDMLDEYDFSGGKRGVYAKRCAQEVTFVVSASKAEDVTPDEGAK